jgi:hypothetical protein
MALLSHFPVDACLPATNHGTIAMALILRGKSKCALCDLVISENDQIVATSHFIADAADPLWRFSDSAMHERCFLGWDQRELFIEKFNQIVSETRGDTYHHMNDDGTIVSRTRS